MLEIKKSDAGIKIVGHLNGFPIVVRKDFSSVKEAEQYLDDMGWKRDEDYHGFFRKAGCFAYT